MFFPKEEVMLLNSYLLKEILQSELVRYFAIGVNVDTLEGEADTVKSL